MAAYNDSDNATGYSNLSGLRSEGREPGARRKKLTGYLKAANDLRQTYFSQDGGSVNNKDGANEAGIEGPGSFPDAAVVRSGHEEMIIFPSYARKHTKMQQRSAATPGEEITEQEYWRREWERQLDESAIVDVDVRGWLYTPHRGQVSRRQRLMIGLARQLSGIPAPSTSQGDEGTRTSSNSSRASSPNRSSNRQDEELIALEAENIIFKGEQEAQYARRGAFSENPNRDRDGDSIYGFRGQDSSRNVSPDRRLGSNRQSQISLASDDSGNLGPVQKTASWASTGKLSPAEMVVANGHLLNRLKPFMANPLPNTPISAFFYNDTSSRQHTVHTNAAGHFTCRAALDFVPTHVRVLASERLSSTEEVNVTSSKGVSLISDIDDTIKHSAISGGAREIFRNAFIRELGDLTIDGVREWYNKMADMGVKMHYVSNSPWQMYPVLTSYFNLANLPRGSFHLKQYSGMLQGIFEPVAERKKSSLERILSDFPERKFILVGDSGEADLEVYTEVAMDHPGRILGVFIRDVTTSVKTGYFDPSNGFGGGKHGRHHSRHRSGDSLAASKRLSRPNDIRQDDEDLKAAIAASLADMEEETRLARRSINPDSPSSDYLGSNPDTQKARSDLSRPRSGQTITNRSSSNISEEDLIDFAEEPAPPPQPWLAPLSRTTTAASDNSVSSKATTSAPPPPSKPQALRSPSPTASQSSEFMTKAPPPRPRKPSSAVKPTQQQIQSWSPAPPMPQPASTTSQHQPSPLSQVTHFTSPPSAKEKPPLPLRPKKSGGLAKGLASAHGGFSSANPPNNREWDAKSRPQATSSLAPSDTLRPLSNLPSKSTDNLRPQLPAHTNTSTKPSLVPPPPPRRRPNAPTHTTLPQQTITARPKTSGRPVSSWVGGGDDRNNNSGDSLPGSPSEAGMSKKEFLWHQRWYRAKNVLDRQGVTLRTWRVGADIQGICEKLVEMEQRVIQREEHRR